MCAPTILVRSLITPNCHCGVIPQTLFNPVRRTRERNIPFPLMRHQVSKFLVKGSFIPRRQSGVTKIWQRSFYDNIDEVHMESKLEPFFKQSAER